MSREIPFCDEIARVDKPTAPRYQRIAGPSAFDSSDPALRELLAQFPRMPACVIAERVGLAGFAVVVSQEGRVHPECAPKAQQTGSAKVTAHCDGPMVTNHARSGRTDKRSPIKVHVQIAAQLREANALDSGIAPRVAHVLPRRDIAHRHDDRRAFHREPPSDNLSRPPRGVYHPPLLFVTVTFLGRGAPFCPQCAVKPPSGPGNTHSQTIDSMMR